MLESKILKVKSAEELADVLKGAFKEAMSKQDGQQANSEVERLSKMIKQGDILADKCGTMDTVLSSLIKDKEERLQVLTLLLRNESKEKRDTHTEMFEEVTKNMKIIATITQVFDVKNAKELIQVLSSVLSTVAIMGDHAIERANRGIKIHKEERYEKDVCDCESCDEESCPSKKDLENKTKENESRPASLDEIIRGILKEVGC